ncbi:hypothetical protein ACEQPO_02660 [Bacillus sp. SL00103]
MVNEGGLYQADWKGIILWSFFPLQPAFQRMDRRRLYYLIMKRLALFKHIHLTPAYQMAVCARKPSAPEGVEETLAMMCCLVFNIAQFAEMLSLTNRLHV